MLAMSHGFVAHATPTYRAMSSGFDPPTLRVVHVDDSALLQDRMRAYFEELGNVQIVGTAEGQSDAIAALSAREYDVVLIDVELRQGTGIPVIRHIREHPPRGESPLIIVFTSFALPAIREHCVRDTWRLCSSSWRRSVAGAPETESTTRCSAPVSHSTPL